MRSMNSRCPYCGEPLHGNDLIPPMSKRRRRLYDAVAKSGSKGIEIEDLLPHMYTTEQEQTPSAWSVLRVQIHELNSDFDKFIGQRPTHWMEVPKPPGKESQ